MTDSAADFTKLLGSMADHLPEPQAPPSDDELVAESRSDLRETLWRRVIPRRFQTASLSDFAHEDPAARAGLSDWATAPRGRNLLLLGPTGVGKTRAAIAACRPRFFSRSEAVVFWPVVELLDALRPGGDAETLAQAVTVDVLILDDLGTEKPTEWTFERLYAVVNRRWLEELPTVGTSNLPASRKSAGDGYDGPTLDEVLGPRMFSRLVGGSVPIRMSGPDRRRTKS